MSELKDRFHRVSELKDKALRVFALRVFELATELAENELDELLQNSDDELRHFIVEFEQHQDEGRRRLRVRNVQFKVTVTS